TCEIPLAAWLHDVGDPFRRGPGRGGSSPAVPAVTLQIGAPGRRGQESGIFSLLVDCRKRNPLQWEGVALFKPEAAMSDATPFQDLIQRLRRGDGDAAAELVKRYEPPIRP